MSLRTHGDLEYSLEDILALRELSEALEARVENTYIRFRELNATREGCLRGLNSALAALSRRLDYEQLRDKQKYPDLARSPFYDPVAAAAAAAAKAAKAAQQAKEDAQQGWLGGIEEDLDRSRSGRSSARESPSKRERDRGRDMLSRSPARPHSARGTRVLSKPTGASSRQSLSRTNSARGVRKKLGSSTSVRRSVRRNPANKSNSQSFSSSYGTSSTKGRAKTAAMSERRRTMGSARDTKARSYLSSTSSMRSKMATSQRRVSARRTAAGRLSQRRYLRPAAKRKEKPVRRLNARFQVVLCYPDGREEIEPDTASDYSDDVPHDVFLERLQREQFLPEMGEFIRQGDESITLSTMPLSP